MIKIKDEVITMDELNSRLKNAMWRGKRIDDLTLQGETISFTNHPYVFLTARLPANPSFSWRVKIFLINLLFDIRSFLGV